MDAESNPPNNVNNRNNGNMVENENAACIEDVEDDGGSNEDVDTEPRRIILKPSLTTPSACAKEAMWEWMRELNHPMIENIPDDSKLEEVPRQYEVTMNLGNDLSKSNLVLYSSVLTLSTDGESVDQHFNGFLNFADSHESVMVKVEMRTLSWVIFCHLYVELLKGNDPKLAADFLRKFVHIVGIVENEYEPVEPLLQPEDEPRYKCHQMTEYFRFQCNGAIGEKIRPSASTKIKFKPCREARTALDKPNVPGHNADDTRGYFQDLIEALSQCHKVEELDAFIITRNFRSCKYEVILSQSSVNSLKSYLAGTGHIMIIQVLQIWIAVDVREQMDLGEFTGEEIEYEYDMKFRPSARHTETQPSSSQNRLHRNQMVFNADNAGIHKILETAEAECKTINNINPAQGFFARSQLIDESVPPIQTTMPKPSVCSESNHNKPSQHFDTDEIMRNIRAAKEELGAQSAPIRVFQFHNTGHQLACADLDSFECHLAVGTDHSSVVLWNLNRSKIGGRKPCAPVSYKFCDWSLANIESSSSDEMDSDSSDDDDDDDSNTTTNGGRQAPPTMFNKTQPKPKPKTWSSLSFDPHRSKRKQKTEYMNKRSTLNTYTDEGYVRLLGHNRGVTDVLFSQYIPALYSTSKDGTIRLWKADDFACASVYYGHNYPIWCIAESSTPAVFATGSRDLTAKVWCTDRRVPLITCTGHSKDVHAIDFHPNGAYMATGSCDTTVRMWRVVTGELVRVMLNRLPIHCVKFSPNGTYLAAAGEDRKVTIFDVASGKECFTLTNHSTDVTNIRWHPSSKGLASCCSDGTVRLYEFDDGSPNSRYINATRKYSTGCRRNVKIFFNNNGTLSVVGH